MSCSLQLVPPTSPINATCRLSAYIVLNVIKYLSNLLRELYEFEGILGYLVKIWERSINEIGSVKYCLINYLTYICLPLIFPCRDRKEVNQRYTIGFGGPLANLIF